ncbi:hypothetical protein CDD83_4227 [Cordyceps sp. RAO-2017]|nr:hypothetical protein CDD83_4227 [Cordyceps sp. RAO-2017]
MLLFVVDSGRLSVRGAAQHFGGRSRDCSHSKRNMGISEMTIVTDAEDPSIDVEIGPKTGLVPWQPAYSPRRAGSTERRTDYKVPTRPAVLFPRTRNAILASDVRLRRSCSLTTDTSEIKRTRPAAWPAQGPHDERRRRFEQARLLVIQTPVLPLPRSTTLHFHLPLPITNATHHLCYGFHDSAGGRRAIRPPRPSHPSLVCPSVPLRPVGSRSLPARPGSPPAEPTVDDDRLNHVSQQAQPLIPVSLTQNRQVTRDTPYQDPEPCGAGFWHPSPPYPGVHASPREGEDKANGPT